jgi:DNA invertase Pin-like site-specific DNA recombinase
MRAALYLRRSTNEKLQTDSLHAQEEILRRYATDHGHKVVAVYRDSASGTTARRPAFEGMVKTITHEPNFELVLCRDCSRFGRFFDVDEGAFYEMLFLSHGVKTIYAEEVFGTEVSPMAGLMKGIRRVMASEYSRDRSRLIRYGQARATQNGFRAGGGTPYAMRRVMVSPEGAVVREMAPGEWKALQNHRTKLIRGPEEEVETVRSIFKDYREGCGPESIAGELNRRGIPSPQGKRWYEATIHQILDNPAYAGIAAYRVRSKGLTDTFVDERLRVVCTEGSFEAVIDDETWGEVQKHRSSITRRKCDGELAADLRQAYENHGIVEQEMLRTIPAPCSWATYWVRFGGPDAALGLAYREAAERERLRLVEILEAGGLEVDPMGDAFRVEGVDVSYGSVFLHASRHGPAWRLDQNRFSAPVHVALGIRPDGTVLRWFVLPGPAAREGARGRWLLSERGRVKAAMVTSDDDLPGRVALLVRRSEAGRRRFRDLVQSLPVMNYLALGRELGWSPSVVRSEYWKLKNSGEWVPPLAKKAHREVEFVCQGCGSRRIMAFGDALALRSGTCGECVRLEKRNRVTIRCPSCGREEERAPSAVKKLSNGAATLCRTCKNRRSTRPHT